MVEGKAKLVIDLGNSETRVITQFGGKSVLTVLPNMMSDLTDGAVATFMKSEDYNEETSRIFEYKGVNYCNGELCEKEFGVTAMTPTALLKKYDTLISELNIQNAFRQGFESVSRIANCDMQSVDVEWDVTVLLPPEDIELGSKVISKKIQGMKTLNFKMPELVKVLNVLSVKVLPEGFAAFIGILFKSKSAIRSEYSFLRNATTLIVDIGAGTTDVIIVKDGKALQSSRFTVEIGGNNVHQIVRSKLKRKGIALPSSTVREGVETGVVKNGSRVVEIATEIAEAKDMVASQLVDAIQMFFEGTMYPVGMIEYVLTCGGGAEKGNVDGVKPMAEYLISYMKKLSPDMELVSDLVEEYKEVGIKAKMPEGREQISPRMYNIIGANILS